MFQRIVAAVCDRRAYAPAIMMCGAADVGQILARFVAGDVADFIVNMPPELAERPAKAPFGEHDCVRLAVARKDAGLAKGALGAIVHAYPDGETFEVEFPDAKPGHEVLTLKAKILVSAAST